MLGWSSWYSKSDLAVSGSPETITSSMSFFWTSELLLLFYLSLYLLLYLLLLLVGDPSSLLDPLIEIFLPGPESLLDLK